MSNPLFFERKVRPPLVARCGDCHGDKEPGGKLALTSTDGISRGDRQNCQYLEAQDVQRRYACFACSVVDRDDELWMYYSAGSGISGSRYRVALATGRLANRPPRTIPDR